MKKILLSLIFTFFAIFSINSNTTVNTIFEGNVDAKIKLLVYESLTCSHCANFHKDIYPKLKEDFVDKGLVKIEFRNFPLDMMAFNASKIAHCRNDGKSEILHFLYDKQNEWVKGNTIEEVNSNLKKVLKDKKITLNFENCLKDISIENHILEDRINGTKKYKVNSTPTIIINDKKFDKPLTYKNLKKTLEKLI
tara:strand:- start:176 stop:757 length:582 start_codon:yes stop_codon:yes gene_type:complete